MKASSEPYFQFPLFLLGLGKDEAYRVRAIGGYSILLAGRAFAAKHKDYEIRGLLEAHAHDFPYTKWDQTDDDHCAVMLGAHILKVNVNDASATLARAAEAEEFIANQEQIYGPSPWVRVKTSFLKDVVERKNGGLTYRDFSVICAIYSAIGDKRSAVRISYDQIRARALGYKTKAMLFDQKGEVHQKGDALLAKRQDGCRPLTRDQVRYTVNFLESRNFFARVCVGRRQTYFSHRLTRAQMHEQLLKQQREKRFILSIRRQQDRALSERIREAYCSNLPHDQTAMGQLQNRTISVHFPT